MSRLTTVGARVRRASGVLPDQVQPTQVTFVAQRVPECSPDLRLERLEGFAGDQFGFPHGSEQDQDVRREMCQVVVPGLILPPTARDLSAQDRQLPSAWLSSLITHRK